MENIMNNITDGAKLQVSDMQENKFYGIYDGEGYCDHALFAKQSGRIYSFNAWESDNGLRFSETDGDEMQYCHIELECVSPHLPLSGLHNKMRELYEENMKLESDNPFYEFRVENTNQSLSQIIKPHKWEVPFFTEKHCISLNDQMAEIGDIVVVKPEYIEDIYRLPMHQLYLYTSFCCNPKSIPCVWICGEPLSDATYAVPIDDDTFALRETSHMLGIMKPEYVTDSIRAKIARLQPQVPCDVSQSDLHDAKNYLACCHNEKGEILAKVMLYGIDCALEYFKIQIKHQYSITLTDPDNQVIARSIAEIEIYINGLEKTNEEK